MFLSKAFANLFLLVYFSFPLALIEPCFMAIFVLTLNISHSNYCMVYHGLSYVFNLHFQVFLVGNFFFVSLWGVDSVDYQFSAVDLHYPATISTSQIPNYQLHLSPLQHKIAFEIRGKFLQ